MSSIAQKIRNGPVTMNMGCAKRARNSGEDRREYEHRGIICKQVM